ncbi:hypothetical protein POTOM_020256 [Populus tomentosa]|uniref:SEC63 domain-containing protein n=1 Tax=Populus tomentosa TaxID=118781 RepID=A0A8X7ZTF3_POPTO|nr:hypothetical protein POTOM_020256 [Populus tomentosa]
MCPKSSLPFPWISNEILMKLEKKDLSRERQNTAHFIHQFPKLNLAAHVQPIIHTAMRGEPTASPDFQWEDKFHGYTEPFWDNDVDSVLHHQYFMLNEQYIDRDRVLNFSHLPPTELLDLQPLPVTVLRNPSYEVLLYSAHLKEIAGNAIVIRRDFGRNLGLQVVELMDWKLLEKGSSIRQHSGEIRCFMLETA